MRERERERQRERERERQRQRYREGIIMINGDINTFFKFEKLR